MPGPNLGDVENWFQCLKELDLKSLGSDDGDEGENQERIRTSKLPDDERIAGEQRIDSRRRERDPYKPQELPSLRGALPRVSSVAVANSVIRRYPQPYRARPRPSAVGIYQHSPIATWISESDPRQAPPISHANLRLIKSWIRTCDTEHAAHCQRLKGHAESGARPIWLVNVKSQNLEIAQAQHQYTALSYVWGHTSSSLCATTWNIDSLQQPAAFENHILPRTIRMAMALTSQIGLTHLWVDRLCIVQDDSDARLNQIHNMASVYANAYLTIVAAAGADADWDMGGLASPNIAPITIPSRESDPGTLRYARSLHEALLIKSPWVTRGWTLQELVFSRRALFVWNKNLTWECHCATWHPLAPATSSTERCKERIIEGSGGLHSATWPDLEEYSRLVADYSSRKLTNVRDTAHAFAGVCNVMSRAFPGGFLHGLPAAFIDVALLWQPLHSIRAKRRLESRYQIGKGDESYYLPRWSWMAWEGSVHPDSWTCGYDYVHKTFRGQRRRWKRWKLTSWKVRPTIAWYGSSSEILDRRPVIPTAWRYRAYTDPACIAVLPVGWHVFTHVNDQDRLQIPRGGE
jgi:hypothetical protein